VVIAQGHDGAGGSLDALELAAQSRTFDLVESAASFADTGERRR
jgi:hypothetical protein